MATERVGTACASFALQTSKVVEQSLGRRRVGRIGPVHEGIIQLRRRADQGLTSAGRYGEITEALFRGE